MRFLVDAQLPPALAEWLRKKGHEATHVREVGLRDADDRSIWAHAVAEAAIMVTKDEDFATLAAMGSEARVLWVRTGNLVNRLLLARFEKSWLEVEDYLAAGSTLVELR